MPKPHLVSYRERIAIDGRPISRERFAAALEAVTPAIERVDARLGPPTEFEALTAAAFAHLADAGIDLALVEVGLGGRLDATNVLDAGVAVITNVSTTGACGSTLAAIGGENGDQAGQPGRHRARGRLAPIQARPGASPSDAPARQVYDATVRRRWGRIVIDATPGGPLPGLKVGC
jgi:hypothetical protein